MSVEAIANTIEKEKKLEIIEAVKTNRKYMELIGS